MGWAIKALAIWKALSKEADLSDKNATLEIAEQGEQKAKSLKGQLGDVYDDLRAALRLVRSYVKGEYRAVSWATIASIMGAIVYFLLPMDAIPDWILGIGLLDDIVILTKVFTMTRKDIQAFRDWENREQENLNQE